MRRGVYPGFFSPPTKAHLALAQAAMEQRNLSHVDLALSRVALGKDAALAPSLEQRLAVLEASTARHDGLGAVITEHQLLADIARGYDCVIMGADKWFQIHELQYYRSEAERDDAIAQLPDPAVAARDGLDVPKSIALSVEEWASEVSSTAARAGRTDWMTPEARESGLWTTDPS